MGIVKTLFVPQGQNCKIETGKEFYDYPGPVSVVVASGSESDKEELTMDERFDMVAKAIEGLKHYQWSRIVQNIDMMFSHQAARVEIDDLELLKENLRNEFK
ncbi:hypothetical protein M3629_03555 [Paenibacillus polysaccharolyticus]|uniref:hypothetical protein n=1 Tax=Paenibacillus polysaccharolyticus TaxID=582692 RepID=UPI002042124A|nr:hypothetical protein [Paenibacillus polysaccharolyticus]MCM3131843.1 hypothetical protein [Paenibacillus polysaccharolyticus]